MKKVAIASLGAIGRVLAQEIAAKLPSYKITAVSANNLDKARDFLEGKKIDAQVVPVENISDDAEIVIECAPAGLFRTIAEPVLAKGQTLVTVSSGALLENWNLVDVAMSTGASIIVPSGAILGLDAVQAVAQGTIASVHMTTRKPPLGLKDAPYVEALGLDITDLTEAVKIFDGTVNDVISGFPANLNVAVSLALAGVGPELTTIEVWIDPSVEHNTHRIEVHADSANLDMTIQNVPSDNPATGRITPLSVIALLKKMANAVQVGT